MRNREIYSKMHSRIDRWCDSPPVVAGLLHIYFFIYDIIMMMVYKKKNWRVFATHISSARVRIIFEPQPHGEGTRTVGVVGCSMCSSP